MDALPIAWVDRIFEKLGVTYGKAFANQYEGIAPEVVKGNWSVELAWFSNRPEAIKWALMNLPERPPNVVEFRALCRLAPTPAAPKLTHEVGGPPPPAVAEALKRFKVEAQEPGMWARRIIERHERGEHVSNASLNAARQALKGRA